MDCRGEWPGECFANVRFGERVRGDDRPIALPRILLCSEIEVEVGLNVLFGAKARSCTILSGSAVVPLSVSGRVSATDDKLGERGDWDVLSVSEVVECLPWRELADVSDAAELAFVSA